jgi:hypothetical protein
MMPAIITEEQLSRLQAICNSLKNSVGIMDIRNWLENFQHKDWNHALTVLERVLYFSVYDIITEYEAGLAKIMAQTTDEVLYLHAIGAYGKSGTAMVYYVKQTEVYRQNEKKIRILSTIKELDDLLADAKLTTPFPLVFLDDIIGSGGTFVTYYQDCLNQSVAFTNHCDRTYILSVVCMQEGKEYIQQQMTSKRLEIIGTILKKVFSSRGSVFGYRPNMVPIRHFCFTYGKGLFVQKDRKTKKVVDHALGYNNSQALVIFAHASPNNTLPILWANKVVRKQQWLPLYPRAGAGKIRVSKAFRNENRLWAVIRSTSAQQKTGSKSFNIELNAQILAIVRLKKKSVAVPTICQLLSMSLNRYEEVIQFGKNQNIFDNQENLTSFGEELYSSFLRKEKIRATNSHASHKIVIEDVLYIPKKFLGKA